MFHTITTLIQTVMFGFTPSSSPYSTDEERMNSQIRIPGLAEARVASTEELALSRWAEG